MPVSFIGANSNMIVGNGLIARAFGASGKLPTGCTVIAAGVSNSSETAVSAFARERATIAPFLGGATHVVYFSSCSIHDPSAAGPYVNHKREMEQLIAESGAGFSIFRLPQVVGFGGNPNGIATSFARAIASGEEFDVWRDAWRYIIDVEDVVAICSAALSPTRSKQICDVVPSEGASPLEIVQSLERIIGKSGRYRVIERGSRYEVVPVSAELVRRASVDFSPGYLDRVLTKYFAV